MEGNLKISIPAPSLLGRVNSEVCSQSPGAPGGTEPQLPTAVPALATSPFLSHFPHSASGASGNPPPNELPALTPVRLCFWKKPSRHGRGHGRFKDRKQLRMSGRKWDWSVGQEPAPDGPWRLGSGFVTSGGATGGFRRGVTGPGLCFRMSPLRGAVQGKSRSWETRQVEVVH